MGGTRPHALLSSMGGSRPHALLWGATILSLMI